MKKAAFISLFCAVSLILSGCGDNAPQLPESSSGSEGQTSTAPTTSLTQEQNVPENTAPEIEAVKSLDAEIKSEKAVIPERNCSVAFGNETIINGDGCWLENNVLSVTEGGIYTLSGTFTGRIYVETDENVMLVFDNLNLTSPDGPAVYCYSAKNLYIKLADGSENKVSDSAEYTFSGKNESAEEEEPDSAIFSKDDLIFCGNGSLEVGGNYKNAIVSKDDLLLESGKISVTAENSGIKGNDSICVIDAVISVVAKADALKTSNDTDDGKGYIVIEGGRLDLTSDKDGIDVATVLKISGGEINVKSLDDCVKTGAELYIGNGKINLTSSEANGISAQGNLVIDDGEFVINGDEGIESKANLTINGGTISVTTADDGLNTGGDDLTVSHNLYINGGNIIIDAEGDGIDSNGDLSISGGTVVVNGPTGNDNGALDCGDMNNTVSVTGGTLFASGSIGMAKAPDQGTSTQYSIGFVPRTSLGKDVQIEIKDSAGTSVFSHKLVKSTQHILFSSADIRNGETYTLYADGTECASVTVNSVVSGEGGGMTGGFGGGPHGGNFGGMPPQKPDGIEGFTPPEGMEGFTPPEGMEDFTPPEKPDGEMQPPPEFTQTA